MVDLTDQSSFFADKDADNERDDDETVYYDLTNNLDADPATGSEAEINGALFFTDQPNSSSGTGLIQAFVRIQDGGNDDSPGFENGYNTDFRPLAYEENTSPSFTTNLLLSAVPVVEINGVQYYEFRLDINQLNSNPLLSLDTIKLYKSDVDVNGDGVIDDADAAQGLIDGTWFTDNATLVYDLDNDLFGVDSDGDGNATTDNSILLNYSLQAGSGKSDMFFYVPVSNFGGADPDTTNVILYSEFGTTETLDASDNLVAIDDPTAADDGISVDPSTIYGDYTANDGFEEWSVSKVFPGVDLTGYKWLDLNGNGAWDVGEVALEGWQINYTVEYTITYKGNQGTNPPVSDSITLSVVTDETGQYTLTVPTFSDKDIQSVEYTVTIYETLQDPSVWFNTYGGYYDSINDLIVSPTILNFTDSQIDGQGGDDIDISGDFGVTELLNFGNTQYGSIEGTKYEDTNGDGSTAGDAGIANWTIYLFDVDPVANPSATPIETTQTDGTGHYSFDQLVPGTYWVAEATQSGWTNTTPVVVSVGPQNSGFDVNNIDFANFDLFDISGTKFEDTNGDGLTAGDSSLGGVTIFIDLDEDGAFDPLVDEFTTTAADGTWSFTGLDASYAGLVVYEVEPDGYVQTLGQAGYVITGTSGTDQSGLDFANFELMYLSGYKFGDFDANGLWDGTDAGLVGWTIVLDSDEIYGNGNEIEVITDATGFYEFAGLGLDTMLGDTAMRDDADGVFHVYEVQQDGFSQTYDGGYSFSISSGLVVSGSLGVAETGNFGNHMLGGANRTPGFWQSKLGQSFYDGIAGNEGDANGDGIPEGNKDFGEEGWSETDLLLLYGVDTDGDGVKDRFELFDARDDVFTDLDGDGIDDDKGFVDMDGDGIDDDGGIYLLPHELHSWVSGGDKGGSRDFLGSLERDLGAAFLNSINNDAIGDSPGGSYAIEPDILDSYLAAVEFIQKWDPDFDGDANGSKKDQQDDWKAYGSDAHNELSAFNESGEAMVEGAFVQVAMDGDDFSSAYVQNYLNAEDTSMMLMQANQIA